MHSTTTPAPLRHRLTVIASLYVSQAIPLGFFIVALPAILRRMDVGLAQIGLLGALAFPWLIKFLWAPLVDRFGSRRLGHYRSWILPLQTLSVLTVTAMAGLDLAHGLTGLIAAGALFMMLSATQDIATDGLAVRSMAPEERGLANGIQVAGYYLGQILGGGMVLVLYDRFGWSIALFVMAVLLALPLVPALRFREPQHGTSRRDRGQPVDFGALRRFASRPGAPLWMLVLVLYRAGDAMVLTMVNPMLVDRGLSLEQIGWLMGLTVSIASLGGALVGGGLVNRIGRRTALATFGILQAFATCGYLLPASGQIALNLLYWVVMFAAFTAGMATAALYTCMMDRSDPDSAATDFTLQQSVCAVGPLLGSILSGLSAQALGYPTHFLLSAGIGVLGAVVVARWVTAETAAPRLRPIHNPT